MDHELARPATVDAEGLDAAEARVDPLPEEDAGEPDLAAAPKPDSDDDLVKALPSSVLDVDVAAQRRGDRGREIAASELLRAPVEVEVPIGDIDRLVRHPAIVTPIVRYSHT